MNINQITKVLDNHGVEVWHGYAVEVYCIGMGNNHGESFKPLTELGTVKSLREWLNY